RRLKARGRTPTARRMVERLTEGRRMEIRFMEIRRMEGRCMADHGMGDRCMDDRFAEDRYVKPHFESAAVVTIDLQNDFSLPGAVAEIPGTAGVLPNAARIAEA